MANSATIQLRIDASTKAKSQKVLKDLGLDLSSAIKLFLAQVVHSRSLPITTLTVNGFTPEQEKKALKELEWTKKYGKRYSSVREAVDAILR